MNFKDVRFWRERFRKHDESRQQYYVIKYICANAINNERKFHVNRDIHYKCRE